MNLPDIKRDAVFTTIDGVALVNGDFDLYPYSWDALKVVQVLNIKMPFKAVVDRSHGVSTCQRCKSRYAGFVNECTHWGYFFKRKNAWSNEKFTTFAQAQRATNYETVEEYFEQCKSTDLVWDKRNEFSEQESFFQCLSNLRSSLFCGGDFGSQSSSGIMKYRDMLPIGVAERIDSEYVQYKVQQMGMQLEQHRAVIKEICQRMQSAGGALMNGGNF